jgi:UDP-N-acetylmuramate: L-alanyl-gamma-D-glutamyl-meso-diaminopimelate ligase
VFQKDFAAALGGADRVIVGAVYRSTLPPHERLSETELVEDLRAGGTPAHHGREVAEIVRMLAGEVRHGDLVVVMSNGDFGGLHDRLLEALRVREGEGTRKGAHG